MIIIGGLEPSSLQTNRFFTREFFLLAKERMEEDGILALTLSGSLQYLKEAQKKLNSSLIKTLRESFSFVKVIPGEPNFVLSSNHPSLLSSFPERLWLRLKERKIKTTLFSLPYLTYRMNFFKEKWFWKTISTSRGEINYDFPPRAVVYTLSLRGAMFSPRVEKFLHWFQKIDPDWFVFAFLSLGLGLFFYLKKRRKPQRGWVIYSIGTSGFCGMSFSLVLLLGFQSLFGYLYQFLGILLGFFMAGATTGSLFGSQKGLSLQPEKKFLYLEALIIGFSLLLAFINAPQNLLIPSLFYLLSFFSGGIIGIEFPLACKIYGKRGKSTAKGVSILYGADLLGGFAAGVGGAIIFVPLWGTNFTLLFLFFLKLSSFIFFWGSGVR